MCRGRRVKGGSPENTAPAAGSTSPQLCMLGLELQFLANQVQELWVGEAWLDLQGDCVFVMHLEDVGAGDGCFGLLQVVN